MKALCDRFQPELIHSHNTFPLISPSYAWMASREGIPVVQTLHNFRFLCPQATLLREGKVCEDCVGTSPWRAVPRKCYRDSMLQSAVSAGVITLHRALGTFQNRITAYIAFNHFCRDKFIQGGLPADRIRIKPHFVKSEHFPDTCERSGGLYVGRLSTEKGLDVLGEAARRVPSAGIQVIGAGPLEEPVRAAFGANYLGPKSRDQVLQLMNRARYLIAPSTCYETFGLSLVEAFSRGTPVIASRHGSFGELVRDGATGLLFNPGDAADLAAKIEWAETHPEEMARMGAAARCEYEARYTPQRNYRMLMRIYEDAIRVTHAQPQVA
jgi:glycosyltransferase involved in cell wall biosynthesis